MRRETIFKRRERFVCDKTTIQFPSKMYQVLDKDTIRIEILPHLLVVKRGFHTSTCLKRVINCVSRLISDPKRVKSDPDTLNSDSGTLMSDPGTLMNGIYSI